MSVRRSARTGLFHEDRTGEVCYCFCGADYLGGQRCKAGSCCPREELGIGQWCRVLEAFRSTPALRDRYPTLSTSAMRKYVEGDGPPYITHPIRRQGHAQPARPSSADMPIGRRTVMMRSQQH